MNLLLDTNVFLFSLLRTDRLTKKVRELIVDPGNRIVISVASLWEITIKQSIGKLELPGDAGVYLPRRITEMGFESLPIQAEHALGIGALPMHHSDPFDRMMIVQAQLEHLTILTSDRVFQRYNVRSILNG